jgi:hypothetical protein
LRRLLRIYTFFGRRAVAPSIPGPDERPCSPGRLRPHKENRDEPRGESLPVPLGLNPVGDLQPVRGCRQRPFRQQLLCRSARARPSPEAVPAIATVRPQLLDQSLGRSPCRTHPAELAPASYPSSSVTHLPRRMNWRWFPALTQ